MPRATEVYHDMPLGQWVAVQRNAYSKRKRCKGNSTTGGTMSDERIERLESIGFSWVLRSSVDEYDHEVDVESSHPQSSSARAAHMPVMKVAKREKRPKEEPALPDEETMPATKQLRAEDMDFIQRVKAI